MEEKQQDSQPIVVGSWKDSVVQKSMSKDDGPYKKKTVYHEDMVTNVAELP